MSDEVERRLVEILGHPTESPYGTPIPGLAGILAAPPVVPDFQDGVVPLTEVATSAPVTVVIRRLAEPLQIPSTLGSLARVDAMPGGTVEVTRVSTGVRLHANGTQVDLVDSDAAHVFVSRH